MDEIKIELIQKACKTFKRIYPCGNKRELFDCFTEMDNKLLLWFNTEDQSTHLVWRAINR
jgi:hypothetical protein